MNYYGKFLPDLSLILTPLYSLLQKETKWTWGVQQKKVFTDVKAMMTSNCLLVHYDPTKELIVACDASLCGIGAMLSHQCEDGQQRPVAYASRTLVVAGKKYSQLEKEACTCHNFCGKEVPHVPLRSTFSDHKLLQHLFHVTTPTMASTRIQR